jgi:hypothetical protein
MSLVKLNTERTESNLITPDKPDAVKLQTDGEFDWAFEVIAEEDRSDTDLDEMFASDYDNCSDFDYDTDTDEHSESNLVASKEGTSSNRTTVRGVVKTNPQI